MQTRIWVDAWHVTRSGLVQWKILERIEKIPLKKSERFWLWKVQHGKLVSWRSLKVVQHFGKKWRAAHCTASKNLVLNLSRNDLVHCKWIYIKEIVIFTSILIFVSKLCFIAAWISFYILFGKHWRKGLTNCFQYNCWLLADC